MSNPVFGKAKYGGGTGWKNFTLEAAKDGTAFSKVFRILPPMKSLQEDGKWAMYHGVHFGYQGVDAKDPNKAKARPFKCIQQKNYKTGMITQECPECTLIESQTALMEQQIKEFEAAKKTKPEIDELIVVMKDWLKAHNVDRKWHINVKSEAGEFGVLKLSHRTKKLLETKIQEVQKEDGIDPSDPATGVWFKFTRQGKQIDAQDSIDVVYDSVKEGTRTIKTLKLAPLTEADAAQAEKDCPDLTKVIREISEDQIRALVKCSGDPEEVDLILGLDKAVPKTETPRSAPSTLPKPTVTVTTDSERPPATAVVPPPPPEDDEETKLLAQLAATRAKKAAAATVPAPALSVPGPVPAPVATSATDPAPGAAAAAMPRDRFMNLFQKKP